MKISLPFDLRIRSCICTQVINQRVSASPFGGSTQVIDLLNDRWLISCETTPYYHGEAAYLEAFIGSLRGQVNTVDIWHFKRPVPMGTLRGTLTLASSAAQGAAVLVVTGGAGQAFATLKQGDLIGVGGLLVMVASDCAANASGVITVPITNRLRVAQNSGAAVTWYRPSIECRLEATSGITYQPGASLPVSFDFGEKI